jgi:hypothetical protein
MYKTQSFILPMLSWNNRENSYYVLMKHGIKLCVLHQGKNTDSVREDDVEEKETGEWRKVHTKKLHNWRSLHQTIKMTKLRKKNARTMQQTWEMSYIQAVYL